MGRVEVAAHGEDVPAVLHLIQQDEADDQHHRHDDDGDGDGADVAAADVLEPVGQAGDGFCFRDQERQALGDTHGAQGAHEGGDLQVGDADAVEQADDQAHGHADDDGQEPVIAQGLLGEVG